MTMRLDEEPPQGSIGGCLLRTKIEMETSSDIEIGLLLAKKSVHSPAESDTSLSAALRREEQGHLCRIVASVERANPGTW